VEYPLLMGSSSHRSGNTFAIHTATRLVTCGEVG